MTEPTNDPYRTLGDSSDDEPAVELKPGMVLNSKYELIEQIGRGGMGVVWKARDTVGDRLVALKFVPRDLQRFESEMQRVRDMFGKVHSLNHQSICPLYGLENGGPQFGHYLVMKYLEGETLYEYVVRADRKRKGFPLSQVATLLTRVAKALDYAHRYDVIHRDIKPSNIFLVNTGKGVEVQVIDFGLADEIKASLTRVSQLTFNISGTRPYMAPEQWRGHRQTAATDQYALGIVAYELLAGYLPFDIKDTELLRLAVMQDTPEPIKKIPEAANAAIRKAMAKDKEDRFESCVAFVKALETPYDLVLEKNHVESKSQSSPAPSARLAVVCSLCLFGFLSFVVLWLFGVSVRTNPSLSSSLAIQDGKQSGDRMELTIQNVKYPFRWCTSGVLMMGSPADEADRDEDETRHQVTLTQGFWFLETPVTQEMWESVMGNNPSRFKGKRLPVENVSWEDCQEYIGRLNRLEAKSLNGTKFSLPTEAQWEYACRAGTTTPFHFGNTLNGDKANCNGNSPYGTTTKGRYLQKTSEPGSYPPNAWGLNDMHGNVWEWCSDWYGAYPSGDVTDPVGASTGSTRVLRGGGWDDLAKYCRSALRDYYEPSVRNGNTGLRLALVRAE